MREKNIHFTFGKQIGKPWGSEGISRSGSTKHQHFMRFHPKLENHKIFFPEEIRDSPDMKELLEELNYITYMSIGSKKDDGLDLLSMISLADITLPMKPSGRSFLERNTLSATQKAILSREGAWFENDEPDASAGY